MKQLSFINNTIRDSQKTLITSTMFYRGNHHFILWESCNTNTICERNVEFPNVTVGSEPFSTVL